MSRNPETARTVQQELARQPSYEENCSVPVTLEGVQFGEAALRARIRYAIDEGKESFPMTYWWALYLADILQLCARLMEEKE